MKIKFSKSIRFAPQWRGNFKLPDNEQFKVDLGVLQFDDLMKVLGAFKKMGDTVDTQEVASVAISILPVYVKLHNLHDDDGEVTVEHLIKYPSYLDLVGEILTKLTEISMPTKEDEKN